MPIGAYLAVPLTWPDGTLFGTLCAIDPLPRPQEIEAELPFVEFMERPDDRRTGAEIRKAAEVLAANFREQDVVARLGGDEFAVLMTEGRAKGEVSPATQIRRALDKAGVAAAIGSETRLIGGLEQAWRNADARMYEDKQLSKDQLQRTEPRIHMAVSGRRACAVAIERTRWETFVVFKKQIK
jgi:GAF domain-containing protein